MSIERSVATTATTAPVPLAERDAATMPKPRKPFGIAKLVTVLVGAALLVLAIVLAIVAVCIFGLHITTLESLRSSKAVGTVYTVYGQTVAYLPLFAYFAWTLPWLAGPKIADAWQYVGLVKPDRRAILWGLGTGAAMLVIVDGIGTVEQNALHLTAEEATSFIKASPSPVYLWTFALMGVLLAPVAEEIAFRGMIFNSLKLRMPLWLAIALTGLAFGIAHASAGDTKTTLANLLPLGVAGAMLAYAYNRTGNLWTSITAHATLNGIGIAAAVVASAFGTKV